VAVAGVNRAGGRDRTQPDRLGRGILIPVRPHPRAGGLVALLYPELGDRVGRGFIRMMMIKREFVAVAPEGDSESKAKYRDREGST